VVFHPFHQSPPFGVKVTHFLNFFNQKDFQSLSIFCVLASAIGFLKFSELIRYSVYFSDMPLYPSYRSQNELMYFAYLPYKYKKL